MLTVGAGWSSPVARQAHNLKVVGSNPTPATIITEQNCRHKSHRKVVFRVVGLCVQIQESSKILLENKSLLQGRCQNAGGASQSEERSGIQTG